MGNVLRFQRPRNRRRLPDSRARGPALVWLALLAAGAGLYGYRISSGPDLATNNPHAAHFAMCGDGLRVSCVVDGDTLWFERTKIRIADMDAPEVSTPACTLEYELGQQATRRLVAWLNEGPFSLTAIDRDKDRYGRSLRILSRGGVSVADTLVSEGLAHRLDAAKRSWCDQ